MTPTIAKVGQAWKITNDEFAVEVFPNLAVLKDGRIAPPGCIARAWLGGKLISDGLCQETITANDPRCGGIGVVGWHHFRGVPGANVWDAAWDMHSRRCAERHGGIGVVRSQVVKPPMVQGKVVEAGFQVDFGDTDSPDPVMSVLYSYVVAAATVQMRVTMKVGAGAFVGRETFLKEPKVCVGLSPSGGVAAIDVLDGKKKPLHRYLTAGLTDPRKGTYQCGFAQREWLRFHSAVGVFEVRAQALPSARSGVGTPWANGRYGLDGWAAAANQRDEMVSAGCADYCLQGPGGTLSRHWEIAHAKGDPHVEVMLHGWEGGYGLPDCLCAARPVKPLDEFSTLLTLAR